MNHPLDGEELRDFKESIAEALHLSGEALCRSMCSLPFFLSLSPFVSLSLSLPNSLPPSLSSCQSPVPCECLLVHSSCLHTTVVKQPESDSTNPNISTEYGSGAVGAVFGHEAWEWIVIQGQSPVNCTIAPHICDDKGRRFKKRILSCYCCEIERGFIRVG